MKMFKNISNMFNSLHNLEQNVVGGATSVVNKSAERKKQYKSDKQLLNKYYKSCKNENIFPEETQYDLTSIKNNSKSYNKKINNVKNAYGKKKKI